MLTEFEASKRFSKYKISYHIEGEIVVPFVHLARSLSRESLVDLVDEDVDVVLHAIFLTRKGTDRESVAERLAHGRMMTCISNRNNVFDVLRKWLVEGPFHERGSTWFVAVNVFPTGTAAEGELVRSDAYNGAILLVKLFDPPEIITTEPLSHCPEWHKGCLFRPRKFCQWMPEQAVAAMKGR